MVGGCVLLYYSSNILRFFNGGLSTTDADEQRLQSRPTKTTCYKARQISTNHFNIKGTSWPKLNHYNMRIFFVNQEKKLATIRHWRSYRDHPHKCSSAPCQGFS